MTEKHKEKVVVITGASGGIGESLALSLCKAENCKYKVALLARRAEQLEVVKKHCTQFTPAENVFVHVADCTKREDVNTALKAIVAHFGTIDVWVNNVGRGIAKLASQLTDEDMDNMMKVNGYSAVYGMQAVLPLFKEKNEGHVINISSIAGRNAMLNPYRSAYAASKHFLNGITDSFRAEVQLTCPAIRVSLVSPGIVGTDFGLNANDTDSRLTANPQSPEEVADIIRGVIEIPTREDICTRSDGREMTIGYLMKRGEVVS